MKNLKLSQARKQKNDEFYTQLIDIEKEMLEYKDQFRGKIIYCNCDDLNKSNFASYFLNNFKELGWKKLTTSCDDFRSEENIKCLKQADIVVTNPPFSLFREYVAQLIEYDKKFIIMGSINAVTYKEIFRLLRDNMMWLGHSIHGGDREFRVPHSYPVKANYRHDAEGNNYIRVPIRWFTNMDHGKRHKDLILEKRYVPCAYPQFDNYEAINVNKTKNIPVDYDGVMGVPITFIDKFNPKQFEIVGLIAGHIKGIAGIPSLTGKHGPYVDGKLKYGRILIKRKIHGA